MFRNVIVGIDGQQGGRDALALAQRLVEPHGHLTLAAIYWDADHTWRGSSAAYDLAERETLRQILADTRSQAGVDAALRCIGASSVGRGLHRLAETTDADLLVIGSSRHGLLGRVLIGDDTRGALNGAPCAVAVAPAGYALAPSAMREIGVGYNDSPESEHALAVARLVAAQHDARLSAFEAVSLPAQAYLSPVPALDDAFEEIVQAARQRVAALDGVEPHAAYGDPAEELAIYSASVDLLVLGSRGYGPMGRLIHGSTTQQLARLARCPLLILTRGARETLPLEGDVEGSEAVPTA